MEARTDRDPGEATVLGYFSGFGGSFGLEAVLTGPASRFGRFCNGRRTQVGANYALIAAMSRCTPMRFMTRVRL